MKATVPCTDCRSVLHQWMSLGCKQARGGEEGPCVQPRYRLECFTSVRLTPSTNSRDTVRGERRVNHAPPGGSPTTRFARRGLAWVSNDEGRTGRLSWGRLTSRCRGDGARQGDVPLEQTSIKPQESAHSETEKINDWRVRRGERERQRSGIETDFEWQLDRRFNYKIKRIRCEELKEENNESLDKEWS